VPSGVPGDATVVLTTERLRLRWFQDDDAAWLCRLLNEPSWLLNIGDRGVRDVAGAVAYVRERLEAGYWRDGFGFWLVERRGDGERLGMCGLTQRDSLPEPDLGFAFLPEFHGRGYAREAAAACLRYADRVLGLCTVLATTAMHNVRSAHLLRHLGMREDPLATHPGDPGDTGPAMRFVWRAAAVPATAAAPDAAAIEAIEERLRRFAAALAQRTDEAAWLPSLPRWCLADAQFRRVAGDGWVAEDLRTFVRRKAAGWPQWSESAGCEVSHRTEVGADVASRWSRWRWQGKSPTDCLGTLACHLVRTARGWQFAAVTWQQDSSGFVGP
jgi:RimJ/RimL family protein N-acetyltransferase